MKACAYFTAAILLIGSIAHGRLVQIWSFQKLFDEADIVMIASLEEPTKRIGTTANLPGESMEFDDVTALFQKRAIFKGKFEPEQWRYNHHWFTEDTKVLISPPPFKNFYADDIGKAYLIFLKKKATGELIPVSGRKQPTSSFIETQPDGAMMFETIESSLSEVEQIVEEQPATSPQSCSVSSEVSASPSASATKPTQIHFSD